MPWTKPAPGYEPVSRPTFTDGLNELLQRIERLEQILGVQQLSGEDERCPWWTNGEGSWALWAGPPSKRRCVLYAGHDGDHRDPPAQPETTAEQETLDA